LSEIVHFREFLPMPISPIEIDQCLQGYFGFPTFRPGQRELIEAVLAGKDALGVLPTGGGKSLIYQLPAVLLPGLTIVVSPLIALIKDQVDAFNRRGDKQAVAIHSNMSFPQAREAMAQAIKGSACMLYVAPERFESAAFRDRILTLQPKLLVIDEAHCVNQWGYDFRPSYLALAGIASSMRPAPVLALTATATPATRKEIVQRLGLKNPAIQVAPFDRPNLYFEVQPCNHYEKLRRLYHILRAEKAGSHIIYVGRRKDADEIAAELDDNDFPAVAYHAGMDAESRRVAQDLWLAGNKPTVVATTAFGMGIDKPDVRAVIHYQHPASLESYYQEAGRAGRDGLPARCVVLYSSKDVSLAHFFIHNRYPTPHQVAQVFSRISPEGTTIQEIRLDMDLSGEQLNVALWVLMDQRKIQREEDGLLKRKNGDSDRIVMNALYTRRKGDYRRLDDVIAYCEDTLCHRSRILRYFGETPAQKHRCGNCSACGKRKQPLNELLTAKSAKTMSDWHRIRKPNATAVEEKQPPAVLEKKDDVLWQTAHRFFTGHELKKRQVSRKTGLAILNAVKDAGTKLAASTLANVLRGARKSSCIAKRAELLTLTQFGAEKGRNYNEVLLDVLAMWAKGYLQSSSDQYKHLELSQKGKAAVDKIADKPLN
jgi:ATP-dependent DNA helicase RecQ